MAKTLSNLKIGQHCKILYINGNVRLKRRMFELGIFIGETIEVLAISPLKNSFLIAVKNYSLAIRKQIASDIVVEIL